MDQALVQGLCIQEGLERRPRRPHPAHHIHMGITGIVGKIGGTSICLHLERVVVHHQHGHRHLGRQAVHPVQQHPLHRGLHVRVQGRGHQGRPVAGTPGARTFRAGFLQQPLRGQRRQPAGPQRRRHHAFDLGVRHFGRRPPAQLDHAVQHLVARGLRGLGVAIGPQARWGLRQGGQHGRFGRAQVAGRLAQP
ncbi:hypothetical protein D9M68_750610 [compost metagenome]